MPLDPAKKAIMDTLMANTQAILAGTTNAVHSQGTGAAVTATGMANLRKIMMPMIRRVIPSMIANQITGVQPMTQHQEGLVFRRTKGWKKQRPAPQKHNRSRRARLYRLWFQGRIKLARKNPKNKPHWRDSQIRYGDHITYPKLYDNLREAFHTWQAEHIHDTDIWIGHYGSNGQWMKWLSDTVKESGCRIGHDMMHDCDAIYCDDVETKIAFLLKWGGSQ